MAMLIMKAKWLLLLVPGALLLAGCSANEQNCDLNPYACTGAGANTGGSGGDGTTGGTATTIGACSDGLKNGDETDVDCGAPSCDPCGIGEACVGKNGGEQDSSCADGNCADGVCCNTACEGVCVACVPAKTGQPNGTCAPVTIDTDLDSECTPDGDGTQKCENTGNCDGNGACKLNGCTFAHATSACQGEVCTFGACSPGFGDCDGDQVNGCETDILSDNINNCGGCAEVCVLQQAVAACMGGKCEIMTCGAGYDDCDGDPTNGCEISILTSLQHCGGCNAACVLPATATSVVCSGGICAIEKCKADVGDCNSVFGDGCEQELASDVNNCGSCGRNCSGANVASRSCSDGLCNSTCKLGFGNCVQPAGEANDNGCETDVKGQVVSCGGCGNNCGQQGSPVGGSPGFECDGGNAVQKYCGCSTDSECDTDAAGTAVGTCGNATGTCTCGGTQCQPAEACLYDSAAAKSVCSCNLGAACGTGETCCQTPSGCFDLWNSPTNCGACGHACPPGFSCGGSVCGCDQNADCNAGTTGTCGLGPAGFVCTCNGNQCAAGQRCQPDGTCG